METSLKVGSLVYCSAQGLGILAKSFFDNGVVTHPYIMPHHCRENHYDWYPKNTPRVHGKDFRPVYNWLSTLDVLLIFETPFDWNIINIARQFGVKTCFMVMYECCHVELPAEPDLWLCPSALDFDYFANTRRRDNGGVRNVQRVAVPVSVEWKQRTIVKEFVHNAGNGGLLGRNGTQELIDALPFVDEGTTIYINTQESNDNHAEAIAKQSSRLDVHYAVQTQPYESLFSQGDMFVFPEKFNGLSLPLQEAYASGMGVMATWRYPNTTYLPLSTLIRVRMTKQNRIGPGFNQFEESITDPMTIAGTINAWNGRDISAFSLRGKEWAEANSWSVWKSRYLDLISK